jgi:hypothetical protein
VKPVLSVNKKGVQKQPLGYSHRIKSKSHVLSDQDDKIFSHEMDRWTQIPSLDDIPYAVGIGPVV